MEKGKLNIGNHVALLYPPGLELIAAFYGCLYVGEYTSATNRYICEKNNSKNPKTTTKTPKNYN